MHSEMSIGPSFIHIRMLSQHALPWNGKHSRGITQGCLPEGLRGGKERKKKVFNNSQIIFKNSLAIISAV